MQEQLDNDRQQRAADRAAAQELLVAACLKSRSAQAAEVDDAEEFFSAESSDDFA